MTTPTPPYEELFATAFANPAYTAATLPPEDVNAKLGNYISAKPLTYTKTQLWDMCQRKASAPQLYLGQPRIKPDTTRRFPSIRKDDKIEEFVRVADHQQWKDPTTYGTVIEYVIVDHEKLLVSFVGLSEFVTPEGEVIKKGPGPLFHVQHGVEGTEEKPLNTWRIVIETEKPDEQALKNFEMLGKSPWLKPYSEYYLKEVLGAGLERKNLG